MAQHGIGYQSQPETHRERANRLKRERRASLDPVEKEALAQLRRESRRQKDPEEQPPVPQQNSNQETAQERANRLKRERRASLDPVETGERSCGTTSGNFITGSGQLITGSGQLITGSRQLITGSGQLITGCWRLIARGRRHGHDDGVLGRSRQ